MGAFDGGFFGAVKNLGTMTVTRGRVNLAEGIKDEVLGTVNEATNGVLGRPSRADPRAGGQYVDQNGVSARPTGNDPSSVATRNLLQQFGPQRQAPQQPGLLGAIGSVFGGILPKPGGITDRVTGGAVTAATNAATQRDSQHRAPVEDRSTYSAGAIAEAKAQGRDTSKMVQTPADKPIVTAAAAAPASPPPAAAAYQEAQTFPVSMPGPIETKPLSSAPAIATTVSPKQDFTAVAPPTPPAAAAPAVQAPAAEFHSRFDAGTNERAQAFLKQSGPGTGPA